MAESLHLAIDAISHRPSFQADMQLVVSGYQVAILLIVRSIGNGMFADRRETTILPAARRRAKRGHRRDGSRIGPTPIANRPRRASASQLSSSGTAITVKAGRVMTTPEM